MTQPNTPAPPPEERAPSNRICIACGNPERAHPVDNGGTLTCKGVYGLPLSNAIALPPPSADATAGERAAAPRAECARLREDVELLRHIALEYAVEARYIESRKHGKSWLYRLGYTDSWFDTREGALAEYIRRAALRAPSTQREE